MKTKSTSKKNKLTSRRRNTLENFNAIKRNLILEEETYLQEKTYYQEEETNLEEETDFEEEKTNLEEERID